MKLLISILVLASGFSAHALTAELTCQPKIYRCGFNGCDWQLLNGEPVGYVDLELDANDEVWRGRYVTGIDGHTLSLDLSYSEGSQGPVRVQGSLITNGVTADTSGAGRVDIALRNQNYGRGFFCRSINILGQ